MTDLGNKSTNELAGFVTRIEDLMSEKAEVSERIKGEYAMAASCGFDKKALRQIIKEREADSEKTILHRTIVETYRRALGGLAGTPLGDWARSWLADDERTRLRQAEEQGKATVEAFEELLKKRKSDAADKDDEEGKDDA